jgi:hypothetical protein
LENAKIPKRREDVASQLQSRTIGPTPNLRLVLRSFIQKGQHFLTGGSQIVLKPSRPHYPGYEIVCQSVAECKVQIQERYESGAVGVLPGGGAEVVDDPGRGVGKISAVNSRPDMSARIAGLLRKQRTN